MKLIKIFNNYSFFAIKKIGLKYYLLFLFFLGELNFKTEKKRNGNRRNQENQQFSAILKQTSLYVNLRCMKLKDGDARIYIGGGITRDSDPAHEWMETVNKAQTMKSVLVK